MWEVGVLVKVSAFFWEVAGSSPIKLQVFWIAQINYKTYQFDVCA